MSKPWIFVSKLLAAAILCGAVMAPGAANAWGWRGGGWGWHGGVYFGFPGPIYVGPPVVYAGPPVVYAPGPPAYAAPYAAPAYAAATSCDAGPYICPLENPGPAGAPCTCPTNTGRVAGSAR
jgi:hypothetical protein